VKSLSGDLLSDTEVWHVHTILDGLIQRMDFKKHEANSGAEPSTAFAKHR
jgi:hypothetical protein